MVPKLIINNRILLCDGYCFLEDGIMV